jgi:hypothetical protein
MIAAMKLYEANIFGKQKNVNIDKKKCQAKIEVSSCYQIRNVRFLRCNGKLL